MTVHHIDDLRFDSEHLATPTGVLVYDGPPHTDAWFDARRAGITATDLPQILGDSDYGNARSVWAAKRGILQTDDAGEAAHWGAVLEEPIAKEWARRNRATIRPVGVLAHYRAQWQRASLDRLVIGCPDGDGPCGLEVKNKSAWLAGRWKDDVPDDVHAQTAWQMRVTGYRHMHVAALIGGNRLASYRVEWDRDVEDWLVDAAAGVWRAVINPDAPPPPIEYDALAKQVIDLIHPEREGVARVPLQTARDALAAYQEAEERLRKANAEAKAAKDAKTGATARLLDLMGSGDVLTVEGSDVALVRVGLVENPGFTQAPYSYRSVKVPKAGRLDLADRIAAAQQHNDTEGAEQ